MVSLWPSSDAAVWQQALDGYDAAVEGLGKKDLLELDRWFYRELPSALQERHHLTQPELAKLVKWKLSRGKNRPSLQGYADRADKEAVQDASTKAFALLAPHHGKEQAPPETVNAALKEMKAVKGVGPATASLILGAYDPSIPFSSDEAMLAALGTKDYTDKKVLELTAALREKASELNESGGGGGGGREWTAKDVEMALFAAASNDAKAAGDSEKAADGGKKAAGGKRAAASDKAEVAKAAKRKR